MTIRQTIDKALENGEIALDVAGAILLNGSAAIDKAEAAGDISADLANRLHVASDDINARKNGDPKYARIIAAANELVAAVLDAGLSLRSTKGVSTIDISVYKSHRDDIVVGNVLSHWSVCGALEHHVSFVPDEIKWGEVK